MSDDRWLELIAYEPDDEVLEYVHASFGEILLEDEEDLSEHGFHIEYVQELKTGEVEFYDLTFGEILVSYDEPMLLYKFSWN